MQKSKTETLIQKYLSHQLNVLAPFDEQTEEEKYREFEDRTEEAKADFENDTMRVVPVSYTHLDVYKRQAITARLPIF